MNGHAKLAPSAAHRWMNCPGSVAACDGLPDESSIYADEGSFAHLVASCGLVAKLPPAHFLGRSSTTFEDFEPDNPEHVFEVTAEMVKALDEYLAEIETLRIVEGIDAEWVETRVVAVDPEVWGTSDYIGWSKSTETLHVVDLKYGAGVWVDVEDNEQLLTYAVGALRTFPDLRPRFVRIHVVQPRCRGEAHRWVEYPIAEVEDFADSLESRADAAQLPNAPLVAGEWCRWCPARANCRALLNHVTAEAVGVFRDRDTLESVDASKAVAALSPEQVARALEAIPMINAWAKAVEAHARELLTAGREVPGWKLVVASGHRKWIDEERAKAVLRTNGVEPFADRVVLSPAQAEKKLGKARKSVLADLCHQPKSIALARSEDKRPTHNPAAVFAAPEGSSQP